MIIGLCVLLLNVLSSHVDIANGNLPPVFKSDLSPPLVKEDTPVGTPILSLAAEDPEGTRLHYGIQGSSAVRVDPNTGVVTVAEPLDREEKDTIRLVATVEDEVQGGDNNIVRVPIELVVLDVNDNPPVFSRNSYEISVPEDSPSGSTVLAGILLSDVDQVGEVLTLKCLDLQNPCEDFALVPEEMTSRSYRGSLVLTKSIPYSARNKFQLELLASDGNNMVSSPLLISVTDVQNSPPVFAGSQTGVVSEDAPIGSLVMVIQAKDGDHGDPRQVMYELTKNPHGFFLLDPESGELRTAKPLDREALEDAAGVVELRVKAYEVVGGVRSPPSLSESSTSIRITIRDVNDEAPRFNNREYHVSVAENIPAGTPLKDLGMTVRDTDVGSNSVFNLRLSDPSGRFSLSPAGGATGSSSVSLRVSKGNLDYENPNERKFLLMVIAEETMTKERLSSTATVVVQVTDTNDNAPVFDQEAYTALVSETATGGTVVTTLRATDPDTGDFGTDGVVYALFGNGAHRFAVDPHSGVITVASCDAPGTPNCLDYETRPTYFLSLRATDEVGEGQTTVVPVRISLRDVNDNPPQFSRPVYRAVIQEGHTEFEPPLVVKATDPDITSRIKYALVGGDPTALFQINDRNGRIWVRSKDGLDIAQIHETEITLTVEANDGLGSHTANIRVSVVDVNNNAPVFEKNLYEASVQEKTPIGSVVEVVLASDADTGMNAEMSFRIMKGSYDDFAVNSSSGEIFVTRELNFDVRNNYNMEIVAMDKGVPGLTSSTTVRIQVIDNNDKNPYFVPTTQRVKVNEDTPPGSVVHLLTAEDLDASSEESLQFAFVGIKAAVDPKGNPLNNDAASALRNLFTVTPNGKIALNGPLNRNVTTEITLSVSVTDVTATPPQTGHGFLVITIVDVNDNPPTFAEPWSVESPFIRVDALEELPMGSVITTISASDLDSNIGRFEFVNPSAELDIDDVTGVVTVKGRLNYEKADSVNATVVVTDTGVPQLTATATLIVQLENMNDEEPKFDSLMYEGRVMEHSLPGTSVLLVRAMDADKDHLGTITYSLAGDHHSYFSIASSGLISVTSDLDREAMSQVRLRAVATDSGPQDTRRQTSVPVHIKILDLNDHAPTFDAELFKASIVGGISPDPPVPILKLAATDQDSGVNSALRFEVTGGEGAELFRLDPFSGILFPAKRLVVQGQPRTYELNVEVRDMNGTGTEPASARAQVTVLPRNEHKPVFQVPPHPNYKATVQEESEANVLVMSVNATDNDAGPNGEVTYHLRVNDITTQETIEFRLDENTGQLRTKKVLDRELNSKYELVLVARDHGSPTSYETLRVVTIIVTDVDDHTPSFAGSQLRPGLAPEFVFEVTENMPKATLVGQTIASDIDSGENARIFYSFISGNVNKSFNIDKSNGNIFTSRPLDREHRRTYDLRVKASNDPNLFQPSETHESILGGEDDDSVARIRIKVRDQNDSPPHFQSNTFYAGVPHTAEVDELVRLVKAKDDDEGKNGSLTYSIKSSVFFRPGDLKPVGSIVPSPFNLTKEGRLLTAVPMAAYRRHRFLLTINAREEAPPHREDTSTVSIWVWERQELIKIVFEQRPEEVVERQEEITMELSRVLDGVAVMDEVRYFTHPNNSVSREWTEVLMHVVNQSSTIVPMDEVLRRVDRGYPLLRESHSTSKIRNIYPAQLAVTKAEVDARMAGLIALIVALFLGFVSFMAVCCCLRFWVMTPAKSREHLIHRTIDDDLGLNTTENPLWVEQKLKTYEEQELSMNVMSEFDPSAGGNPQAIMNGGTTNSAILDAQSNTYATIQKSHGGTIRSLQLRALQEGNLILGNEPGETNDYATLDHLRKTNNASNMGPKVPGVETPLSAVFSYERDSPEIQELVTSFTGSTFQPPDSSMMANRPLPEEPVQGPPGSSNGEGEVALRVNAHGEPCLVAELI